MNSLSTVDLFKSDKMACLFTATNGLPLVLRTITDAVVYTIKITLPSELAPADPMDIDKIGTGPASLSSTFIRS